MSRMAQGRTGMVLAFVFGVVIATAGTATAAKLITGKQIRDGTVSLKDLSKAVQRQLARTGAAGAAGPAGVPGAKGDRGDKGDPGRDGATKVTVRVGGAATAGANGTGPGCVDGVPGGSKGFRDSGGTLTACSGGAGGSSSLTVQCAAGEVATGGGHTYANGKRHALVTESVPQPAGAGQTPTGWRIEVETLTNDASNDTPVTPYVICASP